MDNKSTVLIFDGYSVNRFSFVANNDFNTDKEEIDIPQILRKEVAESSDNAYLVKLLYKSGNKGQNDSPFFLEIEMTGQFTIKSTDFDKETIINQNALAILFPYLRALITTLTANAGVPPLVLPTMNIAKLFEEQETDKNKNSVS